MSTITTKPVHCPVCTHVVFKGFTFAGTGALETKCGSCGTQLRIGVELKPEIHIEVMQGGAENRGIIKNTNRFQGSDLDGISGPRARGNTP